MFLQVVQEARHGHGRADKVAFIRGTRHQIFSNDQIPARQLIPPGAKRRRGNRIRDRDAAIDSSALDVVLQRVKIDMDAIGNKAEPELVRETEGALDDVVMPVHQHGTTVADMGEHGHAMIDGGSQLIQAGIAMSPGNDDSLIGQKLGNFSSGVLLRSQSDQPRHAVGRFEQLLHVGQIRFFHGGKRVSAAITVHGRDEWAFDVNPGDHLAAGLVRFTRGDDLLEPIDQSGHVVRDERGQDRAEAVLFQGRAGLRKVFGLNAIRVEVDAGISVYL